MTCARHHWMEKQLRTWRALLESALNNPNCCPHWRERCERETKGWARLIALL